MSEIKLKGDYPIAVGFKVRFWSYGLGLNPSPNVNLSKHMKVVGKNGFVEVVAENQDVQTVNQEFHRSQLIPDKSAIVVRDESDWMPLMEHLEKLGYKWLNNKNPTEWNNFRKPYTTIYLSDNGLLWGSGDVGSDKRFHYLEIDKGESMTLGGHGSLDTYGDITGNVWTETISTSSGYGHTISITGDERGEYQKWIDRYQRYIDEVGDRHIAYHHTRLSSMQERLTIKDKIMSTVKNIFRSKDDRTLIKAGFINECGDITNEGQTAILQTILNEKKKEIVELAEQVIEEDK